MSERDGWNHLYLIDGATGKVKTQITRGAWPVRHVIKVDEEKRQLWFSAGGMQAGAPDARTLRVGVEAGAPDARTLRVGVEAGAPDARTLRVGVEAGAPDARTLRVGVEAGKEPYFQHYYRINLDGS